jgi:hypothetical protein
MGMGHHPHEEEAILSSISDLSAELQAALEQLKAEIDLEAMAATAAKLAHDQAVEDAVEGVRQGCADDDDSELPGQEPATTPGATARGPPTHRRHDGRTRPCRLTWRGSRAGISTLSLPRI